jgi:hypothetical protein
MAHDPPVELTNESTVRSIDRLAGTKIADPEQLHAV